MWHKIKMNAWMEWNEDRWKIVLFVETRGPRSASFPDKSRRRYLWNKHHIVFESTGRACWRTPSFWQMSDSLSRPGAWTGPLQSWHKSWPPTMTGGRWTPMFHFNSPFRVLHFKICDDCVAGLDMERLEQTKLLHLKPEFILIHIFIVHMDWMARIWFYFTPDVVINHDKWIRRSTGTKSSLSPVVSLQRMSQSRIFWQNRQCTVR